MSLGKTLLIVNPVAKNGQGAAAGSYAAQLLQQAQVLVDVVTTGASGQGAQLAAGAVNKGYHTVIALGGDGIIHEVANGLMSLTQEQRPVFGIIPVGSGNDYARTLSMSEDVSTACDQLLLGNAHTVDVGLCNNEHFVETLSFGIDAAIALETVQRRLRTKKTGNALYFEAGIHQLMFHRDMHAYQAIFDKKESEKGQAFTFAVQLGRTYGGGFYICPKAQPDDGLFDICIAHPPLNLFRAIAVFAKAKKGKHGESSNIEFRRAEHIFVQFEHDVPAQMDGEDCTGRVFDISLLPHALSVLFGSKE